MVRANKTTIYQVKNEEQILLDMMWAILLRTLEEQEGKPFDDAGCDWFTVGDNTYVGDVDWHISSNPEVAKLVNAINSLMGSTEFINRNPNAIF